jgi:hypothetical protein
MAKTTAHDYPEVGAWCLRGDYSCLTLVLYRIRPHNERRVSEAAKGADPIQPFEGSRPWKGIMQIQWAWRYGEGFVNR